MNEYEFIISYIKPELLVLAVVLYLIGMGLKSSKMVKDGLIPLILGLIGVVLAAVYVFATTPIVSAKDILMAIFTALIQGILCAAAPVYINQFIKQVSEVKNSKPDNTISDKTNSSSDNKKDTSG